MKVAPPLLGKPLAHLRFDIAFAGPRVAALDAHAWPTADGPVFASFEDAVEGAHELAERMTFDGMHKMAIQHAHGLVVDGGALRAVPLGAFHRERTGPVFIDGALVTATTSRIEAQRLDPSLQAIVGLNRVLDLRGPDGRATVVLRDVG